MNAAERKYVLVVDDEPDVRNYLAAILEDEGFEVGRAADGNEALEMVKERAPDLISLDLVMPGRSGARFLFALRKNREWSRIPVIIVTGHAHDEEGRSEMKDLLEGKAISGPELCLEKPVTPASYAAAVRRQLGETGTARPAPAGDERAELLREIESADPETVKRLLGLLRREKPDATE